MPAKEGLSHKLKAFSASDDDDNENSDSQSAEQRDGG